MKTFTLGFIFTLLVSVIFFFSCTDSEEERVVSPEISITGEDQITFSDISGNRTIEFNSTSDWTISTSDSRAIGWISVNPLSGKAGESSITITVRDNDTYDDRSAAVTIIAGDVQEVISVTQKKKGALILSPEITEVSQSGGTAKIDVKTNVDYQVIIPDAYKSWITPVQSRGLSTYVLHFTIAANPELDNREGQIIIKDRNSDLSDTVKVFQVQKNSLVLSAKNYVVSDTGFVINVQLKTNVEFDIVLPGAEWIDAVQSRALATYNFKYIISPNGTYDSRDARIIFKDKKSALSDTVYIHQVQKDALILSSEVKEIPQSGGTVKIEVKTNVDYQVIIPDACKSWITLVQSRGLSAYVLHFTIVANPEPDNREGRIIIKDRNSDLSDTVKVFQVQKNSLVLSQKQYQLSEVDTVIDIQLKANVEFDVVSPTANWISRLQTRSMETYHFKYSISLNDTYDSRDAKIIFKDKKSSLSDTVYIAQTCKNALLLSNRICKIGVSGGVIEAELKSTVDFDMQNLDPLWITYVRTRALTVHKMKFEVAYNYGKDDHVGRVVFKDKKSSLTDTLFVYQAGNIKGLAQDRVALIDFYNATGGPNWKDKTNWGTDKPLDQWYGIRCYTDQRVTNIELEDNNLKGHIPESIQDLTELCVLRLSYNSGLTDTIPASVCKLSALLEISLRDCHLSGKLPADIGALKKMKYLYLANNSLSGALPESICNLPELAYVSLYQNSFSDVLPAAIGNLSNLKSLYISSNYFTGSIPASIGLLRKLDQIGLNNCNFSGYVPQEFQNIPNWPELDIERSVLSQRNGVTLKLMDMLYVPLSVKFNRNATEKIINVVSTNPSWSCRVEGDEWCTGVRNGDDLEITATENNTSVTRTAEISITAGTALKVVTVTQLPDGDHLDGDVIKLVSATKGEGVNIVLLGDGFTAADLAIGGKYEQTMRKCASYFLNVEPFLTYKDYFNIYTVVAESNESGTSNASHTANTKFSSRILGMISSDLTLCKKYTEKVPDLGNISNVTTVLVVNSEIRGGTTNMWPDGYSVAMCSGPESMFEGTFHHEVNGHGFGRLADEYTGNSYAIPESEKANLREYQGYGMYQNVDLSADISQTLWKKFVGLEKYPMVGTYEGGFLYDYGVWRPEESSCMIYNEPYFNAPSRETIVKRIKTIAGVNYSFEEFVAKDKIVLPPASRSDRVMPPHTPPVIMK